MPVVWNVVEQRWSGTTVYNNQTWNSNTPIYTGTLDGFTTAQNFEHFATHETREAVTDPDGNSTTISRRILYKR